MGPTEVAVFEVKSLSKYIPNMTVSKSTITKIVVLDDCSRRKVRKRVLCFLFSNDSHLDGLCSPTEGGRRGAGEVDVSIEAGDSTSPLSLLSPMSLSAVEECTLAIFLIRPGTAAVE